MANAQVLHRDHLDSVRAITNSAGAVVERAVYKPFGEQTEWLSASQPAPETKGWIGERFDADAGLQYLNARYYDPVLGMFIQPDWFDVMQPGVGTNRFSYSFNDPINKADQNGNSVEWWQSGPYNPVNGTVAHNEFRFESSEFGYSAETSIFSFNGAKNSGIFGGVNTAINMVNGVPDAILKTGDKSGKFFDYKPITHANEGSRGHKRDLSQQSAWQAQGAVQGVSLTPTPKEELAKAFPTSKGKVLENTITGVDGVTYQITLYASTHTDGLVYYSLKDTGKTQPNMVARAVRSAESAGDDFGNAMRQTWGNGGGFNMPMPPMPGPVRGLWWP